MIQIEGSFAEGVKPGDRAVFTRTFTESDMALFVGLSGDLNPYHIDHAFAKRTRFRKPIVPGLLVGSMITHVGGMWVILAARMTFDFLLPVFVGETITLEVEVLERDRKNRCRFAGRWLNQKGEMVLRADLEGYPPKKEDLKKLIAPPKAKTRRR